MEMGALRFAHLHHYDGRLDVWPDLGGEGFELCQSVIQTPTGTQKIDDEMRHAQGLVLANVFCDLFGMTDEGSTRTRDGIGGEFDGVATIHDVDLRRVTIFRLTERFETIQAGLQLCLISHGKLWV